MAYLVVFTFQHFDNLVSAIKMTLFNAICLQEESRVFNFVTCWFCILAVSFRVLEVDCLDLGIPVQEVHLLLQLTESHR